MATMNISLPDLIRKDQLQAKKLQVMQHAITEGIKSGEPKAWSKEEFKTRMKQQPKDAKL